VASGLVPCLDFSNKLLDSEYELRVVSKERGGAEITRESEIKLQLLLSTSLLHFDPFQLPVSSIRSFSFLLPQIYIFSSSFSTSSHTFITSFTFFLFWLGGDRSQWITFILVLGVGVEIGLGMICVCVCFMCFMSNFCFRGGFCMALLAVAGDCEWNGWMDILPLLTRAGGCEGGLVRRKG